MSSEKVLDQEPFRNYNWRYLTREPAGCIIGIPDDKLGNILIAINNIRIAEGNLNYDYNFMNDGFEKLGDAVKIEDYVHIIEEAMKEHLWRVNKEIQEGVWDESKTSEV